MRRLTTDHPMQCLSRILEIYSQWNLCIFAPGISGNIKDYRRGLKAGNVIADLLIVELLTNRLSKDNTGCEHKTYQRDLTEICKARIEIAPSPWCLVRKHLFCLGEVFLSFFFSFFKLPCELAFLCRHSDRLFCRCCVALPSSWETAFSVRIYI